MTGERVPVCEKAKDQPSFTSVSLLINGWGRGALHVLLLRWAGTSESERHRGTMRDGEREGRSRNSVNGNCSLVCDGVLCTLLAFKIYLKGRERRGSGASLNLRCLFNMCLASTPLGSNLTSVSQKKLQSCEMSSAGRLGGIGWLTFISGFSLWLRFIQFYSFSAWKCWNIYIHLISFF